ncbi:MAG: hypothetical protein O2887_15210 [Bacteroidetes bacterium]|nr:hypothetical protein [Bacteroidota bacterium]MDA1121813.1 hypothetical protein [Bacteroidota bacterium]
MKFINQDSLESIVTSLEFSAAKTDQIIMDLISTDDFLGEIDIELNSIAIEISAGVEGLISLRDELKDKKDSLQATFTELEAFRDQLANEKKALNKILKTIQTGLVRIDSLVSIEDGNVLIFEPDSAVSFRFPISIAADTSSFRVFIGEKNFDLTLEYNRIYNEDEKSRIEVIINNLMVKNHTFKMVELDCTKCTNNSSINAYF